MEYAKLIETAFQGDIVEYQGVKYKVVKVKQVNYGVVDESGRPFNLRIHPSVKILPHGTEFNAPPPPVNQQLIEGQVVRFKRLTDQRKFPGLHIVSRCGIGAERCRLAKLGGDAHRYVTASVNSVEVVTGQFVED